MSSSLEQKIAALMAASHSDDADAAISTWREMSVPEQEDALLLLLAHVDDHLEPTAVHDEIDGEDRPTELVPVSVDVLHELSASSEAPEEDPGRPHTPRIDVAAYRSRWLRRWKWSALVAAWAVTTTFAFTGNVANFGPAEWIVSILMTVAGGGLLVGTLLNFAVAAIPGHATGADQPAADVPTLAS